LEGTIGRSTASIGLSDDEVDDLARYLDVTRAEMLFARGVLLVEGDAERFLMPVFAETLKTPLDHLGISVCSVAGTNFQPYVKFLTGLGIPFAVITDWDPQGDDKTPLGWNRTLGLVEIVHRANTGKSAKDLIKELDAIEDPITFCDRCEEFGVFSNVDTLEIDLFKGDFVTPIVETLRETSFSKERKALIETWSKKPKELNNDEYLKMVETIGKGRFAQRLASRVSGVKPPAYITRAIKFLASRV
jgi:putative ATP-dependent endonuclease of OLD family